MPRASTTPPAPPMADGGQLDLYRDDPAKIAAAYRLAAETVLHDPHFSIEERRQRQAHYRKEADRIEAGTSTP